MYTLQLSNFIFVDIHIGDLFIYYYNNTYVFTYVSENFKPPINEHTIEIIAYHSKRHFVFKRDNEYY